MYVDFVRLYQKGSSDEYFYLKAESDLSAELQKQSQYNLIPQYAMFPIYPKAIIW
jgi:hypothetical protein